MNREGFWSVVDVLNHIYCPWITFNWYVMKIPQTKTVKTEEGLNRQSEYLFRIKKHPERGIGGVKGAKFIIARPVRSTKLMLSGMCDIVVYPNRTPAPLEIKNMKIPQRRPYKNTLIQLTCYAMMMEEEIGVKINIGYIYYLKDRLTQKADICDDMKKLVKKILAEMDLILEKEIGFGKPMSWRCCRDCCYQKICIKYCGL
jgi:CRISPR-associated protein Cas4